MHIEPPSQEAVQDDFRFRELFLARAKQAVAPRRLVMLVDEFDNLAQAQGSDGTSTEPLSLVTFFSGLVADERDIAWVFALGRRVDLLPVQYQSILGKAVTRTLERFPREVSDELLTNTAGDRIRYTEAALARTFELAGGQPYLTQQLGFVLFEKLVVTQDRHVCEANDVDSVVSDVLDRARAALPAMVQVRPAERIMLSAVAESTDNGAWVGLEVITGTLDEQRIKPVPQELQSAPSRLTEWDLLEVRNQNEYRFAVQLIRLWTLQEHPLWRVVQRERDLISPLAAEAYEQAKQARALADLELSERLYREAIRANPVHARAHLELGLLLKELARLAESLDLIKRAAELDPQLAQDEFDSIQSAVDAQAEEADRRARLAIGAGDLSKAERWVDELRHYSLDAPRVRSLERELAAASALASAQQALNQGDYGVAEREVLRSLDLAPRIQRAQQLLEDARRGLENERRLQEAASAFRHRDLATAERLLRETVRLGSSQVQAASELQERVKRAREADALLTQAVAALQRFDLTQASRLLAAVAELDPDSPGLRSAQATLQASESMNAIARLWRRIRAFFAGGASFENGT